MASHDDICLNSDETETFIELWKQHPCLWRSAHPQYKSSSARKQAYHDIADAIACGWSIEQVKRKVESLSAYFRRLQNRKRMAALTGSPEKRKWRHYESLHALLSKEEYPGPSSGPAISSLTLSSSSPSQPMTPPPTFSGHPLTPPTTFSSLHYVVEEHDRDGSASDNPSTDIDMLQEPTSGKKLAASDIPMSVGLPSFNRTMDSKPSSSVPMVKRTAFRNDKKTRNSIGNAVLDWINSDIQLRKMETDDPIVNYSKTVRDRLRQIQSARRLANVKMAIDQVIHNALLEEMPEDD